MVGDAAKDIGEPGAWVDAIQLGRDDQRVAALTILCIELINGY
jgi:hypothetical protein